MSSTLATLALALALAADGSVDERIVCVPSEDGKGWDCGRGANAPAPRSLPPQHNRTAPSAPPPYLVDPSRIPSVSGPPRDAAVATPPEPATTAAASPEPMATPTAAPEPVPAPPAAPETAAAPDMEPVAAPAPSPTPATAAAPVANPSSAPAVRGEADLLALPPAHFTVQLAGATRTDGFVALQDRLGIAAGDCHVVRVNRNGADWWLLLWRSFPDLASARTAAATLGSGYWPRRLAPLQAEIEAAAR